jgi:hypothetical protein
LLCGEHEVERCAQDLFPVTGLPLLGRLSSNCPRYARRCCASNK